jgi:hypothetical protein
VSPLGDSDMAKGKMNTGHLDRPGPYTMNSSERSSQAVTDISDAFQIVVSVSVFANKICRISTCTPGNAILNITSSSEPQTAWNDNPLGSRSKARTSESLVGFV